jgi:hypothetical protein
MWLSFPLPGKFPLRIAYLVLDVFLRFWAALVVLSVTEKD